MANLYEINTEMLNCVDMETGEILDIEKLKNLKIEREKKIENLALWYKNLQSDAKAYGEEKKMFTEREATAKRKAESIKSYLNQEMAGKKFKTTRVSVSYRKSKSVDIEDVYAVPDEYHKEVIPDVDKTAVRKAIESGKVVDGCTLVEKLNIQIK